MSNNHSDPRAQSSLPGAGEDETEGWDLASRLAILFFLACQLGIVGLLFYRYAIGLGEAIEQLAPPLFFPSAGLWELRQYKLLRALCGLGFIFGICGILFGWRKKALLGRSLPARSRGILIAYSCSLVIWAPLVWGWVSYVGPALARNSLRRLDTALLLASGSMKRLVTEYQAAHDGELPASADDLFRWGRSIPPAPYLRGDREYDDPFASPKSKPLGFASHGGKWVIVSRGPDGRFDFPFHDKAKLISAIENPRPYTFRPTEDIFVKGDLVYHSHYWRVDRLP